MSIVTVRDVKVFVTAPHKQNLVVVKVETSESGLYGLGCATFTWRYEAVVTAIEKYIKPMMIGRPVAKIEDAWQSLMGSSYWRNGPVLNNAISGVDEALWDIKGKMANMPLYDLFGGKCREGAAVYKHASGDSVDEVKEKIDAYIQDGYRHIRLQKGSYGGNLNGNIQTIKKPENSPTGTYYSPKAYMRDTVELFDKVRSNLGYDIELIHDVHERLTPVEALDFAKEMEQFKLFYLEDCLRPEQADYFELIRKQTSVPLAMGELFTNPVEWRKLVQNQWIDFIRVHLSDIGGITPSRKLAIFCEEYQVRTAWHGPNDLSPIGMAAQIHLDLSSINFGIQEFIGFNEEEEEIFQGCPQVRDGYVYIHDKPGIGVDFDEKAALKYPPINQNCDWVFSRLEDGTSVRP